MLTYTLARAISMFLEVMVFMIVIHAVLSWFARPGSGSFKLYTMLGQITEPLVNPWRKVSARFAYRTGIDFAPVLAIIFLQFLGRVIIRLLMRV